MPPIASDRLVDALTLTAAVMGAELSALVIRALADDLAAEPEPAVLAALDRCRRELTGRLTLALILERLDDGRPGPEAAWAGCPRDEGETVVWTEEQRDAFGDAARHGADRVAARMTFREVYPRLVAEARAARRPVRWVVSLGHDAASRPGPIAQAVAEGRLAAGEAAPYLDAGAVHPRPALPAGAPTPVRGALGAIFAAAGADDPAAAGPAPWGEGPVDPDPDVVDACAPPPEAYHATDGATRGRIARYWRRKFEAGLAAHDAEVKARRAATADREAARRETLAAQAQALRGREPGDESETEERRR